MKSTIFSNEKYRLLGWLSLILVAGFLGTSLAGFMVSRDTIRHDITSETLPLTSDNIYSEIQKDLLRPIFISSVMAQDTFLRDWLLSGEKDTTSIVRYLAEVKQKYHTVSSSLVSERTRRYYYPDGVLKTVSENELRDIWYFRVRNMKPIYETNIDPDLANGDTMTIFVNYRVMDYDGNFIGSTGVGLATDTLAGIIDNYENRFKRKICFVDHQGNIVLAGKASQRHGTKLDSQPGLSTLAQQILASTTAPRELDYELKGSTIHVNARFIPELNWFLVVEQTEDKELQPIERILNLNLLLSTGITLLVLISVWFTLNRYHLHMETLATTDPLTRCINRQAFDIILNQSLLDANRRGESLALILMDIDFFKNVNDEYGHLAGDTVLREVADLARHTLRSNDVIVRWGGEEFLILLKNCTIQKASDVAEKLRTAVSGHHFNLSEKNILKVTVSLGITECHSDEMATASFARADAALYAAKAAGRDCVRIHETVAA